MYKTLFSKCVPIDNAAERQWLEAELQHRQLAAYQAGAGFCAYQFTDDCVWLHSSSDSPIVDDIEAVEKVLKDFLIAFRPEEFIGLEYAFCADDSHFSRSEDLFGGGASLITAKDVLTITTDVWLDQQIQRLKRPENGLP